VAYSVDPPKHGGSNHSKEQNHAPKHRYCDDDNKDRVGINRIPDAIDKVLSGPIEDFKGIRCSTSVECHCGVVSGVWLLCVDDFVTKLA
jgi:hypothetical protein